MKRLHLTLLLSLVLLFTHCQSESGQADRGGAAAGDSQSALASGNALRGAVAAQGAETVHFTTSDGVRIEGSFYAAGSSAPAVLCLHQWRSDRSSFAGLAEQLQAAGYSVLTIDMRGYGGSTRTEAGKRIRPDRKAQKDIEAAMGFLRAQKSVNPSRIGIIGASYGSSNAIIYAGGEPAVKAVVLLSPGLNYFNELPTEDAVRAYGSRPLLVVASSEDLRSVETVDAYAGLAGGMQSHVYENAGHGTDILAASVGLDREILAFLKKNL